MVRKNSRDDLLERLKAAVSKPEESFSNVEDSKGDDDILRRS